MVESRLRGWSPLAVLLGVLLVLGAVAAPAQAAITRKLTLHPSAYYVGTGASVTFSGTLAPTPTGSSLTFQVQVAGRWIDARNVKTTNSAGAYKVAVQMPTYTGKYYFRTVAKATSTRSSATSNIVTITVMKKVTVSIKASRTTVPEGGSTTFSGHVSSCAVGASVALQRFSSSGWVRVAGATLSSSCTYSKLIHPTASASYRVYAAKHGAYAPGYSASVRITYQGPAPTPPTITTTSLPNGSVGSAYSQTLSKNGAAGTWSKVSGSLPNGLALSSSTGKISGTPTTGGTFSFTVRYTETTSRLSASKALSITIVNGPAITTTSLPDGKRGVAYAATFTKTGAAGTWSALHLPSGVTLNADTGEISGTPVVSGDFTVAATFTETVSGKKAFASFPLHIAPSPPPVITTTTLPDGVKSGAYSATLTETSDSGLAGTWAITQGSLPPGITLDASTGQLSGTPTAADDYGFTVTFTETAAQTSDSQALLLHVSPAANSPSITTTSLADGTVGAAYPTQQLQGSGAGTWSISKFALPPGLSLNGLTGQITGTPTNAGDYVFQVKYTTLTGSNTKILAIHVNPAP